MRGASAEIAVIGAGVAGLATAFDLETRGRARGTNLNVTVFESSKSIGGKLRTIRDGGYIVEEGPNGWLDNEPATPALLRQLGLEDRVVRSEDAARRRFILIGGRLRELPLSPPAFVRSDILPFPSKLRVAGEVLVPRGKHVGRAAEGPTLDETVFDFGRRRLGRRFAELLLDPMVKGIFGGDARRLSLAAAFPRMAELERDYGGLFKAMIRLSVEKRKNGGRVSSPAGPGGALTCPREGMGVLPRAIRGALRGEVLTSTHVTDVSRREDSWWVSAGGARRGPFACVIDAAPAHAAAEHLAGFEISRQLAEIPYVPMAVVTLAFDRTQVGHPLSGFGALNPTSEGRRLLGVLWTTSIFKGRAPGGMVTLRCMAGGAANPEVVDLTDDELVCLCMEEIAPLYGIKGDRRRAWVVRHEKAIAQYEKGHLARLRRIQSRLESLPGLFLTGSSYNGVSTNHCIAEAGRTADAALGFVSSRARTGIEEKSARRVVGG